MKFISAGSQDNENQKELIIKKLSKFIARYKKKKKTVFVLFLMILIFTNLENYIEYLFYSKFLIK